MASKEVEVKDEAKDEIKSGKKVSKASKKTTKKPKVVAKATNEVPVVEVKDVKSSPGITSYEAIRQEVEKPTAKREQIETRRGNLRTPRRYHLTSTKMAKLMEKNTDGSFPNPYRKGGIYHALVQSLANLGVNARHRFDVVVIEVQKVLGQFVTKDKVNAWDAFAGRESRNELSGKDIRGRILQNAMVLQRLTGFHLYGEKLRQLCSCIDIFKDTDGLPLLKLNTKFDVAEAVAPVNELRSPKNRGRRKKVVATEAAVEVKSEETPVEVLEVPEETEIPEVIESTVAETIVETSEDVVDISTV